MNQSTKEWMESNVLMKKLFKAIEGGDKPDMAVVYAIQRQMEINIKRVHAHVAMFNTAEKNSRAKSRWERMNLQDDTAVDLLLGDPEDDKLKCPEQDHLITRHECLDYSGEANNHDTCAHCDLGLDTKRKLLVPSPAEEGKP